MIHLSSCADPGTQTYYISTSGSDNNSGTNKDEPWRSIARINSQKLNPGDSVFFESGCVWRELLRIRFSGSKDQKIYYGSYGVGNKPKILGSEYCQTWSKTGVSDLWVSENKFKNPNKKRNPSEVFFIDLNENPVWGQFVKYKNVNQNTGDSLVWSYHKGKITISSPDDPNKNYLGIEAPQRKSSIRLSNFKSVNHIELDGLDLRFATSYGIRGGVFIRDQQGLVIRNCKIGWIGAKGGPKGYGIETNHSNLLIENCEINDCGRRGISFNIYAHGTIERLNQWLYTIGNQKHMFNSKNRGYSNITVQNSLFYNGQHTTSLDLAIMEGCTGANISDVQFHSNIILEDQALKIGEQENNPSNQIFIQEGGGRINNVFIYNNIFREATSRHILLEGGDTVYILNNTIFGYNQNGIPHPYASVSINYTKQVDFRNNVLYLDLPLKVHDHGILMYYEGSHFLFRDHNLYWQELEEKDFTGGIHGYYSTLGWHEFLRKNPSFEENSPEPSDPMLEIKGNLIVLEKRSPARNAGIEVPFIKFDLRGKEMNSPPDLGAIQYDSALLGQK